MIYFVLGIVGKYSFGETIYNIVVKVQDSLKIHGNLLAYRMAGFIYSCFFLKHTKGMCLFYSFSGAETLRSMSNGLPLPPSASGGATDGEPPSFSSVCCLLDPPASCLDSHPWLNSLV